jgi:adenylate cyclase
MKISVRIKLTVILSILMSFMIITIGIIMTAHERVSLEAQMRNMASTITDEFASDSKMPLLQNDHLTMNLLVQNILKYPGIVNAYILNEKLFIEGHKEINEVGMKYYGNTDAILKSEEPFPWLIQEDEVILTFSSPIIFKETKVGYVVISFSKDFIKEKVKDAQKRIVLITISVIGIVIILSIPLASELLKPVFMLVKGTKEIAIGNLWYRIPSGKKDEIGELIASFNNMAAELEKKEVLKGAFNRYVSAPVADEILKNPEKIHLGGEKREITVLFADIRGFTALTRQKQPEEIVELLNKHFTILTEIIFYFNGTVDKFIGDAVMGVFGAPILREDHLEYAIKAAIVVNKVMEAVNRLREKKGIARLPVGLGLDSGDVIVGSMGSKARMEYTAIGDPVNVASRLTGIAKDGEILIGESLYSKVKNLVSCIKMPDVNIKGIEKPFAIYNVVDSKDVWRADIENVVNSTLAGIRKEGIVL